MADQVPMEEMAERLQCLIDHISRSNSRIIVKANSVEAVSILNRVPEDWMVVFSLEEEVQRLAKFMGSVKVLFQIEGLEC